MIRRALVLALSLALVANAQAQSLGPQPVPGAGQTPGTATNDNASAGNVGQFISATVLSGAAVSLTNNTAADVTSVSLTAGDWDCRGGTFYTNGAGTTVTNALAWTSATSATLPTQPNNGGESQIVGQTFTNGLPSLSAGVQRFSLSATTTVFLSAFATFATSTLSAYGFLGCRRVR